MISVIDWDTPPLECECLACGWFGNEDELTFGGYCPNCGREDLILEYGADEDEEAAE